MACRRISAGESCLQYGSGFRPRQRLEAQGNLRHDGLGDGHFTGVVAAKRFTTAASPVALEFVVRPPLRAGPGPGSVRPNALFNSARATVCPPAKVNGVWPLLRDVAACCVVAGLQVGKFPFKITGIPEPHMVEEFSPHRADQALHERV